MARRQSKAVYRRRRIVVLTALIVLIVALSVAIWAVVARPWEAPAESQQTSAEKTPTPDVSENSGIEDLLTPTPEDPSSEETEDPEAPAEEKEETPEETQETPPTVGACAKDQIEVVAITDAESYAADARPLLSLSLTNTGEADCIIDVGSATQKFTITSGSDVWWRSTDCQSEPSSLEVTLAAGQTTTTAAPVEWDRTRSRTDTCDQEGRPVAPGGGASYNLAVSIGGFDSVASKRFFLH